MSKNKGELFNKKIDCFTLYTYSNVLFDVIEVLKSHISEEAFALLHTAMLMIDDEIGHLDCDELVNCYIVEEGYNYSD